MGKLFGILLIEVANKFKANLGKKLAWFFKEQIVEVSAKSLFYVDS
jgi:hypothetical protein